MDSILNFIIVLGIIIGLVGIGVNLNNIGYKAGYEQRIIEENQKIEEKYKKTWEYSLFAGEDKSTYMGMFTTPYGPLMNSSEFEIKEDLVGPYWVRENVRIEIRSDEITKTAREFKRSKKGLE